MAIEPLRSFIIRSFCSIRCALVPLCVTILSVRAEEQLSVDDQEHLDVQNDLSTLSIGIWTLVIGLLIFAFSIRYVARHTTRPCHWCMEFIKKSAVICPRCGKKTWTEPAEESQTLKGSK